MRSIFIHLLPVILFSHTTAYGLSVVYNFRIAQITRKPIAHPKIQRPFSLETLCFDLFQKMHAFDIKENYAGGLITFNYNFAEKYYFRTDLAVAHINQTVNSLPAVNEIEPDDILFTLGRNFTLSPKSRITASGLFGIPTHPIFTLQRVGFGSGQVGIGAQIDGLYKMSKHIDFLWGARYNYFIPQTALGIAQPSLNILDRPYKFTIGSIADVLVALQTNRPLSHGIEGGYDARWGFGIKSCPNILNLSLLNYMRNNFYLVYKYTFLTKRVAHRFLFNISYGFDVKPKLYGYNAVMVWTSWGIAF